MMRQPENMIGRKRPFDDGGGLQSFLRSTHSGGDDLDFLAPLFGSGAGMRIESRNENAGAANAKVSQGLIGQVDFLANRLPRQQ
jgi:hypothetical protein